MSDLEFPEWQEPYLEALMETDQRKLVGRVDLAERTIFLRLKEIQSSSKRGSEEQAIEDALRALTLLRKGESGVGAFSLGKARRPFQFNSM